MENKIVIGLWPLSGDFGKISMSQFEKTTSFAIDLGIKTFDVAPNYGSGFAENALGDIYQGREPLIINTKFGNNVKGEKNFTPSALRRSLESSLKRLKVEKVNTLFLHNPRDEIKDYHPIENLMSDLKSEGLIEKSGISVAKGHFYEYLPKLDCVQFDCNLLYLKELDSYSNTFPYNYVRSPLASGILSGRLSSKSTFTIDDQRSGWLKGERLKSILMRVNKLEEQYKDIELSSLARRFLLQNKDINHIIFGVKNTSQIQDIVNDIEKVPLEKEIISSIIELEKNNFGLSKNEGLGF